MGGFCLGLNLSYKKRMHYALPFNFLGENVGNWARGRWTSFKNDIVWAGL